MTETRRIHRLAPPVPGPSEEPSATEPTYVVAHRPPPEGSLVTHSAATGWVWLTVAVAAGVLGAALIGALLAVHLVRSTASSAPHAVSPVTAYPEERMVQTMDLCTRFAVAESTIPPRPQGAADVVPAADYLADALREDGVADDLVRTALAESLRQLRSQGAVLSGVAAQGAVQPVTPWTAATAAAANERAWALCHAYHG